jgi:hypothetical protein
MNIDEEDFPKAKTTCVYLYNINFKKNQAYFKRKQATELRK